MKTTRLKIDTALSVSLTRIQTLFSTKSAMAAALEEEKKASARLRDELRRLREDKAALHERIDREIEANAILYNRLAARDNFIEKMIDKAGKTRRELAAKAIAAAKGKAVPC
jgi:isoleucyl-tRNA synthetase